MTTLTRAAPAPAAVARSTPDGWEAEEAVRDPRQPRSDDELIACTLITLWALTTGRTLPAGVPPARLPEWRLIEFWSDPAFEHTEVH